MRLIYRFLFAFSAAVMWVEPSIGQSGPRDTVFARRSLERADSLITMGFALAAKPFIDNALRIFQEVCGTSSVQSANALHQRGRYYYLQLNSNAREALFWYDSAYAIRQKLLSEDHLDIAHSHNNRGLAKAQLGYIHEAIELQHKGLKIRRAKLAPGHELIGRSLLNLGQAYGMAHEPEKCIDYSLQALAIYSRLPPVGTQPLAVALINNNMGGAYLYQEEWDKALEYFGQALDILKRIRGEMSAEAIAVRSNIGNVYSGKKQYDKALEVYFVLEAALAKSSSKNPSLTAVWTNIGFAYQKMGRLTEADHWHRRALSLAVELYGPKHPEVARGYQNVGSDLSLQHKLTEAPLYFDSARAALDIDNRNIRAVIDPEVYYNIESSAIEAYFLSYFLTDDPIHLQYAIRSTMALDKFTDAIRPNYTGRHARRYLQQLAKLRYERGVYACHLLWQHDRRASLLDTAFYLAEKSKALALYGAMQAAQALKMSGIPEHLLRREETLRTDLADVEKRYWAAQINKGDTTALNGEAAEKRRTYDDFVAQIAKEYPAYDRLRFNLPVIATDDIRKKYLPAGTTLLQYLAGDTTLFIFALRSDTLVLREIPKTFPLDEHIQHLLDGIIGYPQAMNEAEEQKSINRYLRAARVLYDSLIAPVAPFLDSQLIIVPDGRLALVPFEALLTEMPARMDRLYAFPYLLFKHRIRYAYSATLLDEMSTDDDVSLHPFAARRSFVGFAPWYRPKEGSGRRDSLEWLDASGEELRQIGQLFHESALFFYKDATVQQFRDWAPQSAILHVSSHARADDRGGEYAFISFAPQQQADTSDLLLSDIYNLSLPADMVVVSACQTNTGKWSKGEGILSLARAFAYAGAKSIVSSLWKVNDEATKELMIAFYKSLVHPSQANGNIAQDGSKDRALQTAKLQLVNSRSKWSHPYYWAGFVLIGDDRPLAKTGKK